MSRGAFIVFEGIDRCGKTTQSTKLVDNLIKAGLATKHMRFPETGKALDAYLRGVTDTEDHSVHLLFSANRWEARNNLKKTLGEGTTLVVDRYAYSGVVYTASKNPDVGLPRPDLVIFLDISVEDAMKRGDFGQERYEKKEFQEKVRQLYLRMVEDNWRLVDATQSQEDLEEQLLTMVKEVQEKVGSEPIHELWVGQA